jgi:hypothetical protein
VHSIFSLEWKTVNSHENDLQFTDSDWTGIWDLRWKYDLATVCWSFSHETWQAIGGFVIRSSSIRGEIISIFLHGRFLQIFWVVEYQTWSEFL